MSEHTLTIDDYEAVNLLWLLRVAARHTQLNTGDWCGQILHQLEAIRTTMESDDVPNDAVAELDALYAAIDATTAEVER